MIRFGFLVAAAIAAFGVPAAIAQTVRVTEEPYVSQPHPFAGGQTVVLPRTRIEVDEGAPMPKPAPRPPVTATAVPPVAAPPAASARDGTSIDGVFLGSGEPKVVVLPDRITEPRLVAALKAHGFSAEETAAIVASARAGGKVSAR